MTKNDQLASRRIEKIAAKRRETENGTRSTEKKYSQKQRKGIREMSSTNRGAQRIESDFYPTPLSAFTPLLPFLPAHCKYWEPACGDGRLIKAMKLAGLDADGSDIVIDGMSFLQDETDREVIITNPPFSLALEFCDHALDRANEVYMLLRLNFLGSQSRHDWWKKNEPGALFVLSKRPSFVNGKTDSNEYAWFYWGPKHRHRGIYHLL